MENKEEKNIMRAVYIPIIISLAIGLVIGLTIVILSFRFFMNLPRIEEQLKFSPFYQVGQWKCEEENFVIVSNFNEESEFILPDNVSGAFISENEETYDFTLSFLPTRGFNSNCAVVIYLICEEAEIRYSCYYKFNEENFVLKDIYCSLGEDIFDGKKELHFNKVA